MEVNIVHKIHAGKKLLLAGGGGSIKLAVFTPSYISWFQRLFLIFIRVRKNEHLPASLAIRSRRFAHFQHLTNISVIMHETVPPDIFSAPPQL